MGNYLEKEQPPPPPPPPPVVIVPPLFDFPPLAVRTRMLESSYNLLFGKLALRCLFDDYFEDARHFSSRIMLKPIDDPHADLVATVSGPFDHKPDENIVGNAEFRWQSNVNDLHTFTDLFVSNSDPILRLRSCAYYPKYGFGAFGIFPLLLKNREYSGNQGLMGLRYGSTNLSFGTTFLPLLLGDDIPKSAWLIRRIGRLTAGVQYEPQIGAKDVEKYKDLANWSYAIGYGVGSGSPLSPSFNFCLELAKGSEFIASFYQHVVVQRRVRTSLEEKEAFGITNYIDFGFELKTSIDNDKAKNTIQNSTFQVAASWQVNKNFLLKGKIGPLSSSLALAFKSWWKPAFTFNLSAKRDRTDGKTAFGFGILVDNVREASYHRADPNFVMLKPNKEHLAEGIQWKIGERPMFESDLRSGNFEGIPRELRPLDKIL
ncbi:Beta-galactosidase 9 [Heracleum sosnowskyi]|uniref:Beta-galactosidase 9 n=1 Tax=Heracleum sosnowskyi TaxID=360622 RepID=A0AAD8JJP4_9APIA|nr:Beta-galactosidase 9 [Heracleum sosnowskyi]